MEIKIGRRFWIAATAAIMVFTGIIVVRNLIHAVKIKGQLGTLEREYDYYREKVVQDSTLIEHLRYDDYLEEYARENFHMQRRDEHVYIVKE